MPDAGAYLGLLRNANVEPDQRERRRQIVEGLDAIGGWSDPAGNKLEAAFCALYGNVVTVQTREGKTLQMFLGRLVPADTAFANDYAKRLKARSFADDYVKKPVGLAELRSRIRAVLRRAWSWTADDEVFSVGPLVLDRGKREVIVRGASISLTFSEFELLTCLMVQPGRLFSRQELMRAIWGDSAYRDPRGVDVHVRHLREKLEEQPESPTLILTVRGAGYRLRDL